MEQVHILLLTRVGCLDIEGGHVYSTTRSRRRLDQRGSLPRLETPGVPFKTRLLSNTTTLPVFALNEIRGYFNAVQGNTITLKTRARLEVLGTFFRLSGFLNDRAPQPIQN